MKRVHHEDFTFYDHQQTSQGIPERDEREAREEDRARREGAGREASEKRPVHLRIVEGIQALLSGRTLL